VRTCIVLRSRTSLAYQMRNEIMFAKRHRRRVTSANGMVRPCSNLASKAVGAPWAQVVDRGGKKKRHNVLAIALANKLARIGAILRKGRCFECVKTDAMAPRPL
jgi:hypothetical protein